jgi:DNA replication ATP-dependent helicase Dna2
MQSADSKRIDVLNAELELILISSADVNDQFNALSRFFYKLVKTSTNEDNTAFRNFYARFRYLVTQIELSENDRLNIDAFRRFIKRGNQKQATPQTIQQGVALLSKVLRLLADNNLALKPGIQQSAYKEKYFYNLFPKRKYNAVKSLKVLCASWTEVIDNKGTASFTLYAYDLESLEEKVEILIQKHPYADFTNIRDLLTENAILQLQQVEFTGKAANQYSTTHKSLITLEPDFLIDATAIGECFNNYGSNSDIFFLSKMITDLAGMPALRGGIIGYYLDEIVRDNEQCTKALYLSAQRNNALKAAQFGSMEMQKMKQSIEKEHLNNIKDLAAKHIGKELWLEPTYFSDEYGLAGRLDLLSIDNKLNTKDIVELKSSKPTNADNMQAWANHRMQVVCYDMLLQSTYGANREGTNTIFYSKCPVKPYRPIVSEHSEKVMVLKVRNEIVAKLYKLAGTDFSQLQKIKDQGIVGIPSYLENELKTFQRLYDPGRIATQYYQELLAFTLRELINDKVGDLRREDDETCQYGYAGLWLDDLSAKESDFRIIYDLKVADIDKQNGIITLSFGKEISHSFRKGDSIILYPKTQDAYNPLTQHILKGYINDIHLTGIVISLFNLQTNYSFINAHTHWAIEPDMFERNFWSIISCLFNVLSCSDRKKRLLFGHMEPAFDTTSVYQNEFLTPIQNMAIQQALNAKDYYLLQGPPGTGKTSTFLVHYIKEALRTTTDKIVILAFTNKAVEKICESFNAPRNGESPIEYIRLGSKHVEDKRLFSSLVQDDDPDNWRKIIDEHRVFVTTVATFQNNWLLLKEFIQYKQVVVDEASQLTEAALSGILVLFEKFILIGDQKQLPSVVTQDVRTCLTKSTYLNQLRITDFRISLFERLIRNAEIKGWGMAYGQLADHYRMHQEIASLISRHYSKSLLPGRDKQKSTAPPYALSDSHLLSHLSPHRIVFIESPSEVSLKKNKKEAIIAATIAQDLIDAGIVKPKEIGIITPFRAQIAEIKKHIRTEILNDKNFIIDTVERYQGDERRIIIFSTTITCSRLIGAIQSIASNDDDKTDRKLLVSISRASEQFIVLGNSAALQAANAYREIIDQIKLKNGYLGIDFSDTILNGKEDEMRA